MADEQFLGLSFAELVDRIQEDIQFGRDFEALVLDVTKRGDDKFDSADGRRLLRYFAKDEDELGQLLAARNVIEGVLANNRVRTVPTTHTGTYTTGSQACTEEERKLIEAGFAPPHFD